MADRDAWEQPLYRFAHLLLRDVEAARMIVLETLDASAKKRPSHIEPERLIMQQFQEVRRRALKGAAPTAETRAERVSLPDAANQVVAGADAGKLEAILHALPEPGRSAYALLLYDALESEWIGKMLGLASVEFAEIVQGARLAVHDALARPTEVSQ